MIESRLDAYRRGDFASLLKWYRYDQEAALQAPRGRRQETREQKLKRVLALLLSVLFLLEGAEPAACRYTEAAARLFPAPLLSGLGWASLF